MTYLILYRQKEKGLRAEPAHIDYQGRALLCAFSRAIIASWTSMLQCRLISEVMTVNPWNCFAGVN